MDSFFLKTGIRGTDFIQISILFILLMLVFFGTKAKRYLWLNWFLLVVFALQCVFVIVFRDGLNAKLFAGLMLTSTLIVEAVVTHRKKLAIRTH